MNSSKNLYGDDLSLVNKGQGVDVASQRLDDLDMAALRAIRATCDATNGAVAVADYGCGRGGFAKAARAVTPQVDAIDQGSFAKEFQGQGINFRQADLVEDLADRLEAYHVILCQRTIHYFRYPTAVSVCRQFRAALRPGGLLFLSASGLGSELSQGYQHAGLGPESRFCKLSPVMQTKHGILYPVCLYTEGDLCGLIQEAGLSVREAWTSAFGNIKLIAEIG